MKYRILTLLLLVGCAYEKDDFDKRSPDSIYKKGMQLLNGGEYSDAASEFKDIESLFPYSSRAVEGQILSAYAYFLGKQYLDTIREINVFLRYHPSHELVPYAMYLKAMCLYKQVSAVGRDGKTALDAKEAFVELANRFPNSVYYKDCIQKIIVLDNLSAAHNMAIGRYYQKHKNASAAIGRYNYIITNYNHSYYIPEAYFRLIECCISLGLLSEAKQAYITMTNSLPNDKWTKKAKNIVK